MLLQASDFADSHSLQTDTAPKEFQAGVSATNVENGDSSSEQKIQKENLISVANFQLRANISSVTP